MGKDLGKNNRDEHKEMNPCSIKTFGGKVLLRRKYLLVLLWLY